jgi:hypothetical protein
LDGNLTRLRNPRFAWPTVTLFLVLTGMELVFVGSGAVDLLIGRWAEGAALLAIAAAGLFGVVVAASR